MMRAHTAGSSVQIETSNRFTDGKGWLQGTQVFLQIGLCDRPGSTGAGNGSSPAVPVAPSSGATKGYVADVVDVAQVAITVCERVYLRVCIPDLFDQTSHIHPFKAEMEHVGSSPN